MNKFIQLAQKKNTVTENGAVSNSTTGNELTDQFGKAGSYRNRPISDVFRDQAKLDGSVGHVWALRFVLYLRLITRVINFFGMFKTENVQRGQGAKDESIKRFLWYAINEPDLFRKYLPLFISVGSFKDLSTMYLIIHVNDTVFDQRLKNELVEFFYEQIVSDNNGLALKYMPLVKSTKKCKTVEAFARNHFARDIRERLGLVDVEMRKLKSSGSAHVWQKLISQRKFSNIDFNRIPGRALFLMVTGKFLSNQNLRDKYTEWLATKPVAKFTGYVYELASKISYDSIVRKTLDKQFKGLLETSGNIDRKWIVALDTSGSMGSQTQAGVAAIVVAKSLAVYFANLMKGAFHKVFIVFSTKCELRKIASNGFCDQVQEIQGGMGSTNFQSVIDLFVKIRKENPDTKLEEFPNGVIVVSDMQFNPAEEYVSGVDNPNGYHGTYQSWIKPATTNYETAMKKLRQVFPTEWVDNFKIVWWDCVSRNRDFPSVNTDTGTICISGFDGAVIANLFGKEQKENNEKPSMVDVVKDTLSQEILLLVE